MSLDELKKQNKILREQLINAKEEAVNNILTDFMNNILNPEIPLEVKKVILISNTKTIMNIFNE